MTSERDLEGAIETYTGTKVWPLDPRAEDVHIEDIAHSLSMTCRFNGHTKRFYSVAEHCINMTRLVPIDLKASALLHDAAETYISDIPRPTKLKLNGIDEVEDEWLSVMQEKWDVPLSPLPHEIKEIDRRLCAQEAKHLMPSGGEWWPNRPEPSKLDPDFFEIQFTPVEVENEFMRVFNLLAEGFYIDTT